MKTKPAPPPAADNDSQLWQRLCGNATGRVDSGHPADDIKGRKNRQEFIPHKVVKRVVADQQTRAIARQIRKACPWMEDADAPAARAWAQLDRLAELAYARLKEGILNDEGEPRGLLEAYQRLRKTQLLFAQQLGLTPAARVAIKATGSRVALDLAAQLARADIQDAEIIEPPRNPQTRGPDDSAF